MSVGIKVSYTQKQNIRVFMVLQIGEMWRSERQLHHDMCSRMYWRSAMNNNPVEAWGGERESPPCVWRTVATWGSALARTSENDQSAFRYEAMWWWGRGRELTLYPANKKGASASAISTVDAKTKSPRTDGDRTVAALVTQSPLPPLLPITQRNVVLEREKARLPSL